MEMFSGLTSVLQTFLTKTQGAYTKVLVERRKSTGSDSFSLLTRLDATVFSLIETKCPEIWAKNLPKKAKRSTFG